MSTQPDSADLVAELDAMAAGWLCAGLPDADLPRRAAREIERLTGVVKRANDQAEHFERLWHLTKEDADRYEFAKTLEGQVVTMETFKARGGAELDQALDDAMAEDADARNEAGYAA
jgi:hypothetical protein